MLSVSIIIVIFVVSAFLAWVIYKIFTVKTYKAPPPQLHEDTWNYIVN